MIRTTLSHRSEGTPWSQPLPVLCMTFGIITARKKKCCSILYIAESYWRKAKQSKYLKSPPPSSQTIVCHTCDCGEHAWRVSAPEGPPVGWRGWSSPVWPAAAAAPAACKLPPWPQHVPPASCTAPSWPSADPRAPFWRSPACHAARAPPIEQHFEFKVVCQEATCQEQHFEFKVVCQEATCQEQHVKFKVVCQEAHAKISN
jgi:hypothetical protein